MAHCGLLLLVLYCCNLLWFRWLIVTYRSSMLMVAYSDSLWLFVVFCGSFWLIMTRCGSFLLKMAPCGLVDCDVLGFTVAHCSSHLSLWLIVGDDWEVILDHCGWFCLLVAICCSLWLILAHFSSLSLILCYRYSFWLAIVRYVSFRLILGDCGSMWFIVAHIDSL